MNEPKVLAGSGEVPPAAPGPTDTELLDALEWAAWAYDTQVGFDGFRLVTTGSNPKIIVQGNSLRELAAAIIAVRKGAPDAE